MHPDPPRCVIRSAVPADAETTARLHVHELPLRLFPRLGQRFVARWHRAFVQSSHAVALVAVDPGPDRGGAIAGFLMGATDRQAFLRDVLTRHRWALLGHGVLALVVRPRTLIAFVRTRMRPYLRRLRSAERDPRRTPGTDSSGATEAVADLTAVAVAPANRRTGAGRALVEEFLHRCVRAGTHSVELVAAADSADAVAFYSTRGWTTLRTDVTRDGTPVRHFGRRAGGS